MSGSSTIVTSNVAIDGGYRTDRATAIARSAAAAAQAAASGATAQPMSAEDFGKTFDQADLDLLNSAESSVALGQGGGRLIGVVTSSNNGPVQISGAAATLYLQTHSNQFKSASTTAQGKQPVAMFDALNVDFVMNNIDKSQSKSVADYAEYVRNEVADLQKRYDKVIFVGASGTNRVTTDVNEYVGWLGDAVMKRAATLTKAGTAG